MLEIECVVSGQETRAMVDVMGAIAIVEYEKGEASPYRPPRCWLHTVVGSYLVRSSYSDLTRAVARRRQQAV